MLTVIVGLVCFTLGWYLRGVRLVRRGQSKSVWMDSTLVQWQCKSRPAAPGRKEHYFQLNSHCRVSLFDSSYREYRGWYINIDIGDDHYTSQDVDGTEIPPLSLEDAKKLAESYIPWCNMKMCQMGLVKNRHTTLTKELLE